MFANDMKNKYLVIAEAATGDNGGDKKTEAEAKYTRPAAALGAAIGAHRGYRHIGPWLGKKASNIRDRFDKDLQSSKKRVASAEKELKTAKQLAKRSGGNAYDSAVSQAESRLASAKKEAAPHLARAEKRKEKYIKAGRVVGTPMGAAIGTATGGTAGFMADFTKAYSDAINKDPSDDT